MTLQTQRAHVREVALASTLYYRHDVIGIPQIPPAAPILFELFPRFVVELALVFSKRLRIDSAERAGAVVAQKDLLA